MTAGVLIIPQFMPARNLAGASVAAEMVFYLADTNDLEPVYTDNTLSVAHPSPLQSDASGYFPVIWADTSKSFDVGFAKDNGEPPLTVTGVSSGTSLTASSAQQASDAATAANTAKLAAEAAQAATEALYGDATALEDAVEAAGTARDQAVQAAQASGGIPLNIPWLDKSADYTVLIADAGKAFDLTGTHTLSLSSAATLAANFAFAARNSGTGIWTIDPNGAELIDGRSTIKVYPGEEFFVGNTGSGFRTIGRNRNGPMTLSRVTASGSNVTFTTELTDTEFDWFELILDGVSLDATATLRVHIDTGSGFAAPGTGRKSTAFGSFTSNTNGDIGDSGAGAAVLTSGEIRFSTSGRLFSRMSDTGNTINQYFTDVTGLVGIRVVGSTGSLDAGVIRLVGHRKAS